MADPNEAARIREKAREAQDLVRQGCPFTTTMLISQAAAAQANLHHAAQQARVATINATATQAALDSATNSSTPTVATAQPLRKTAGRYALADFAIERT
jgi:protein kinase A